MDEITWINTFKTYIKDADPTMLDLIENDKAELKIIRRNNKKISCVIYTYYTDLVCCMLTVIHEDSKLKSEEFIIYDIVKF